MLHVGQAICSECGELIQVQLEWDGLIIDRKCLCCGQIVEEWEKSCAKMD